MASQFTYEGLPRFSYFWGNPNHAAAVLVYLLPFFWQSTIPSEFEKQRASKQAVLLLGEAFLGIMIALSYSRAAALAWIFALLVFTFLIRHAIRPDRHVPLRILARVVFFLGALAASGLFNRIQSIAHGDASATNRLELWRGGLELIASSPLSGWGKGNSGWIFMQWLQRTDVETQIGGMNNTFLHLAVEYGLVGLGIASALIVFAFALNALIFRVKPTPLRATVMAALVTLIVCHSFTTLWQEPAGITLFAATLIASLFSVPKHHRVPTVRVALLLSVSIALIVSTAVYGFAVHSRNRGDWRIDRNPDGSITLIAKTFTSQGVTVTLLPDEQALGRIYGHPIRSAATAVASSVSKLVLYPPAVRPTGPLSGLILIFGPRFDETVSFESGSALYYICPSTPPPRGDPIPALAAILLPEFDQIGTARLWRKWAVRHDATLHTIPGVGQNIDSEWPKIFGNVVSVFRRPSP